MFGVLGYVLFAEVQMGIGVHVKNSDQVCYPNVTGYEVYRTDCPHVQAPGNVNFDTLIESILSLCVLLSTSNFPGQVCAACMIYR